ncbi:MAG: glycosyltransferase family 4 protein [Balneolales bacterium]|nr:glycosyltransferase family 4 protein [Balneolales bacterium]
MKILFFTQYYPPEIGAGAVRANAIVSYFRKINWNVKVLCERPNYPTGIVPEGYRNNDRSVETDGGITVYRVPVWASRRENRWQQTLQFGSYMLSSFFTALKLNPNFDIIYISSPPLFGAVAAAVYARITGIPWVFEVRDLWPDSMLAAKGSSNESGLFRLLKILEHSLYMRAAAVVCVTEAAARRVREMSPNAQVHVVSNGADTNIFRALEEDEKEESAPELSQQVFYEGDGLKANQSEGVKKFRVGYVGSVGVIHDFLPVIKAAKLCEALPEIEFYIVGDGSKSRQLNELLEQYKPANVKWVGLRPHAQVPAIIRTFNIGLNPIRNVSVFNSIITVKFYEYLACGVPVISLGKGMMKQAGDDSGAAVTLPPGDAEALSAEIQAIMHNRKRWNAMRRAAIQYTQENYDRDIQSARLAEILKSIARKD